MYTYLNIPSILIATVVYDNTTCTSKLCWCWCHALPVLPQSCEQPPPHRIWDLYLSSCRQLQHQARDCTLAFFLYSIHVHKCMLAPTLLKPIPSPPPTHTHLLHSFLNILAWGELYRFPIMFVTVLLLVTRCPLCYVVFWSTYPEISSWRGSMVLRCAGVSFHSGVYLEVGGERHLTQTGGWQLSTFSRRFST